MVCCNLADFGCLAEGVLQAGASLRFQARGSSMAPTIRDGDTLLVAPALAPRLRVGQIVLSRTATEKIVVHRILRRRQRDGALHFLLKGDRCNCPDGWVDSSAILGQAIQVHRQGRVVHLDGGKQQLWGLLAAVLSARNLFTSPLACWLVRVRSRFRRYHLSSSGAA